MVLRPSGSGTISFGLVSIPVKLYSSANPGVAISFNQLHKTCKGRLRQQLICPKEDNMVVPREDIVKGYEFAKDQYVTFNEEELKELQEVSTEAIDITEFVPESSVPPLYFEKTHYLSPDKGGDRAYRLLSEALKATGKSALAKYSARGKQHLVMISPYKTGLIMYQLYYADEVRPFDEVPLPSTEVKDAEMKLAKVLIEQGSTDAFRPENYHDEVRKRTEELIQKKVEGQEVSVAKAEPKAQIIDLMEALKASLGEKAEEVAEDEAAPQKKPAKRASRKGKSDPVASEG